MSDTGRIGQHRRSALRQAVAVLAVFVGLVATPAAGFAWADPATSDPTSTGTTSHTEKPTDTAPDTTTSDQDSPKPTATEPKSDEPTVDQPTGQEPDSDEPAGDEPDSDEPDTEESTSAEPTATETAPATAKPEAPKNTVTEELSTTHPIEPTKPAEPAKPAEPTHPVEPAAVAPTEHTTTNTETNTVETAAPRTATAATAVTTTAVVQTPAAQVTAPLTPAPLSPLAEILQLPGRIVNAVLQAFGFTSSATSPASLFNFAPIDNLLFAVFREIEHAFGLDRAWAPAPAVPTMTYTGPTTTQTPTVAQFLNASAAGYGLGTTPGGLVPFVADGFQMSLTNILSGMVGTAWVTPQQQIIIAYQGTTGGTNLLFNPLIAISQVLADMQVILTRTTPWAFHDALLFARRVQDEATKQGYGADDVFVTGHSLGGWEAEFVAQRTGLGGIGFESPGINTTVAGNGASSMFVNIATYGDTAAYLSTDLPGLQPFMPAYVPGGGSKPHYGSIVMIGDPDAMTPLRNAATLWGKGLIASFIFAVDFFGNFF